MTAGPNIFPVSPDRHGARMWQRFRSYDFVQDHQIVPIVLGEHEQVAATLPIVARQSESGLWPMALTRLGARTAVVAPNGVWRGSYVPSILRVHPFQARMTTGGQSVLLVDEDSGLIAPAPATGPKQGWERFFAEDGQLAPILTDIVEFFQARAAAVARTRSAMAALAATEVFTKETPILASLSLPEGVMWADPAALEGLGRSELALLHRTGALALAHAMLIARHHLEFLAQAEAQLDQPRAQPVSHSPAAQPRPEDIALAGFFDALASSQAQERPDAATPRALYSGPKADDS